MASTMELEAKNVEQAVKIACEKFNLSPQEIQYDVISYGSSGIFGLGKIRNAKIRVVIPKSDAAPPDIPRETGTSEFAEDVKARVQDLIQETFQPSEKMPEGSPETTTAKGVLQQIVDSITDGAEVEVAENGNRLVFQVRGGNPSLLIGKHGQTLQSMQALIDKIVNRNHHRRMRVEVDVEGYLENRNHNLKRHAIRMAKKCKRTGRPVIIGKMNAHDRRIVHLTLKNDRDVRTNSSGEGKTRKLTVFPKKPFTRSRSSR